VDGIDPTMPFHIKRAKFLRKTGCNGILHTALDGTRPAGIKNAAAHVVGWLGEKPVEAWFVPDDDSAVMREQSSAHEISEIVPVDDFAGSCRVRAEGLESVLCVLVDANKLVQLAGRGVRRIFGDSEPVTELVYLEDLTIEATLGRMEGLIRLENVASREGGGRLFTLNRLTHGDGMAPIVLARIALSFHLPQSSAV